MRSIPALAGPVSDLLDNMRHGSVPMTLATLIINGVGEELFFRDVARRALSDASSPSLIFQVALYIAVTAAMGVPLLLVASILIGGIAALEARRADNLLRHHAAPGLEHRDGVCVASSYRVGSNPLPSLRRR